jgi:hypothetical protein
MFLGQLLLTGIFGRTGFEVVVMVQPIILRRRAARRHSDEIQSFGNESRLKPTHQPSPLPAKPDLPVGCAGAGSDVFGSGNAANQNGASAGWRTEGLWTDW